MPETTEQKSTTEESKTNGKAAGTWDEWLATQDETAKTLYSAHTEGLLNTVKATREERDALKDQMKALSKSQAAGSDVQKELDAVITKLEASERHSAFLEEATRPEVLCRNPKAAWLIAQAGDLFDKRNNPNWAAIKVAAPELFGALTSKANAGAGTKDDLSPTASMNNFIRAAAGRPTE